jgi:DNA replication protein DnaC
LNDIIYDDSANEYDFNTIWNKLQKKELSKLPSEVADTSLQLESKYNNTCFDWISSTEYLKKLEDDLKNQKVPQHLTTDQRSLLYRWGKHIDEMVEYKKHVHATKPNQLKDLVIGGPGVGKSYCIHTIRNMITSAGLVSGVFAYMGTVASMYEGGDTAQTAFHFSGQYFLTSNTFKPYNEPELSKRTNFTNWIQSLDYLIIDEISMLTTNEIGLITQRCVEMLTDVMNEHSLLMPFDGINSIFVGDFSQIQPVQAVSIYKDILMY